MADNEQSEAEPFWDCGCVWEDFSPQKISGVYALFLEGKIQYIGKSEDLTNRIRGHKKERKILFDQVKITRHDPKLLSQLELKVIKANRPPLNIVGVKKSAVPRKRNIVVTHGYWERPESQDDR